MATAEQASAETIQRILGYHFRDSALLEEALTHRSRANEQKDKECKHNERLEFLGDAVLSLIMSEHLATTFPKWTEGALSKLKARLVSESCLAKAGHRLGLGDHLRLGRGEELSGGREKNSLVADALEALIAAIYLDGGLQASRQFTLSVLEHELRAVTLMEVPPGSSDFKTQLQELCQKRFETLPTYVVVREHGPDHEKLFEVELMIRGEVVGVGQGRTKKEAEQMAAKGVLECLAA